MAQLTLASRRRLLALGALALPVVLLVCLGPGRSRAAEGAQPPVLWTAGQNCHEETKVDAGECSNAGESPGGGTFVETDRPTGIATDPATGVIYVADTSNNRIVELSPWGQFVESWGWGVQNGAPQLQVCTPVTGCKRGLAGAGVGEFNGPTGIAVDSQGDIYVQELNNLRVQKFTSTGEFLLMFGGEVDKGPNHQGNLCTATFVSEGDACGQGVAGTSTGAFSAWNPAPWVEPGNGLAVGAGGDVFVGDQNRIQRFSSSGIYQAQLSLSAERRVVALAVDTKANSLYYITDFEYKPDLFETEPLSVHKIDATTGKSLGELQADWPVGVAVGRNGDVYVSEHWYGPNYLPETQRHAPRIVQFDASGKRLAIFADEVTNSNATTGTDYETPLGIATGAACFTSGDGVYATNFNPFESMDSFVRGYGIPDKAALCPPPPVPPQIGSEYALSVNAEGAALGADINPKFWPDTSYHVEYATATCVEEGGWEAPCVAKQPMGANSKLNPGVVTVDVSTPPTYVSGLAPDTAYRYRFVAESGGGGPTVGVGRSFHTLPLSAAPNVDCPNQVFRTGASAPLPDCRAFELVSPLDKAGGDILARLIAIPVAARLDQSSATGDALAYSSYRAFGDAKSAPFSSEYLARRSPASGWESENLSPPQEGVGFVSLANIDVPYSAFNQNLDTGWLFTNFEPVLGPGGIAGWPNLYRRDNAGGTYRGCTNSEPRLANNFEVPELQGVSEDQHLAVFRVKNQLTDDALETTKSYQLYACSFGPEGGAKVQLVSILPNGKPSKNPNTLGGPRNAGFAEDMGRSGTVVNAVSADGSRVFWTASPEENIFAEAPGSLYLRLNPSSEPTVSGKCDEAEPEAACTVLVASGKSRYFSAAKDGSKVIYGKTVEGTASESLLEYNVDEGATHLIAEEVLGFVGASEDASHVYFISRQDLADGATVGSRNLYLHVSTEGGGRTTYLARLDGETDTHNGYKPLPSNVRPNWHAARVSPDGAALAFMSDSPLLAEDTAGYDNTDQETGLPASEVYHYRIGEKVVCISCNRTGSLPQGRNVTYPQLSHSEPLIAASLLQPWENSRYGPRDLSDDGARVYFDSFEPLVSTDTNGKADVYQWEEAGSGDCAVGDPAYDPKAGGCITLISSGKSSADSEFVDASPDGRDVFIRTAQSLLSYDPGQVDIYDARVGGGFPPPPTPDAGCEGEACQGPLSPPVDPTPASSSFIGAGNVTEASTKKARRKHRKKRRRHHHKPASQQSRGSNHRRAGR